jgi:hypothetical protein
MKRDRAPKFSGSKFIKQAGRDSADSSPKAERAPRTKEAFLVYHLEQVTEIGGYSLSVHNHMLFHWLL